MICNSVAFVNGKMIRTLAGSTGLVAAVPLTTLMATFYVTKMVKKK